MALLLHQNIKMEEENKKQIEEKKSITKKISSESNSSSSSAKSESVDNKKSKVSDINKKQDKKDIRNKNKKEEKGVKESAETLAKKTGAVVNARNLSISTKHAIAVCDYIWGKNIDEAISMLEEVSKFKKPIPMKGEIPHRKGRIMSGRYPIKASREFIKLLKSLKANALVNGLELEKYVVFCKADVAPRPYKRFGRARFKRSHVTLKLILPRKKARRGVKK